MILTNLRNQLIKLAGLKASKQKDGPPTAAGLRVSEFGAH